MPSPGIFWAQGGLRLERSVACRDGKPLIDLSQLSDLAFVRGLAAVFSSSPICRSI
jgi:hypothetical protein